jgi:outer membrane protein assembly factor BamB
MHRRDVLALAGLVGTGGCLRLQEGGTTEAETATPGTGDTDSDDGVGATAGEEDTEDTVGTGEVTLTERWTDGWHVNDGWVSNQTFYLSGTDGVGTAHQSEMGWTAELADDDILGTEAFGISGGRAVFGLSPDPDGQGYSPNVGARFYAYDHPAGERAWRFDAPADARHNYARGVAVVDGVAAVGSHTYGMDIDYDPLVTGVDMGTGEQVWETHLAEVGGRYLVDVATYDGAVCVGSTGTSDAGITLLDPATGEVVQHFDRIRMSTDGAAVSGSSYYPCAFDQMAAYSLDDGSTRWSTDVDDRIGAQPVVDNTLVVCGTVAGTVYALERDTGTVRWQASVDETVESVALSVSHVWVANQASGLTGFARDDGSVVHRSTQDVSDLAVYDDTLLVGGDDTTAYTIE